MCLLIYSEYDNIPNFTWVMHILFEYSLDLDLDSFVFGICISTGVNFSILCKAGVELHDPLGYQQVFEYVQISQCHCNDDNVEVRESDSSSS